jgi:uncharacterized protein YbaR (Trm112 family)
MSGRVPADLLDLLVCPQDACKGELHLVTDGDAHVSLDCPACKLSYPIDEGIPVMLVEEARPLAPAVAAASPTKSTGAAPA